jgi:hypothetical protein
MSFAYHYELRNTSGSNSEKTVKGILSIDGEELLFEYKVYDLNQTSISTLNKYAVTVDLISSIRFKKTLFSNYVIIETAQPVFLDPLPGSSKGTIQLKIDREHRTQAEDFCSKINVALEKRNEA